MKLILAADLMDGQVVHGASGLRDTYLPLDWGIASTAEPEGYITEIGPRHLYIADLDRIERTGDNSEVICSCASLVQTCWLDRGTKYPGDILEEQRITPVIGTETGGDNLSLYRTGILSIDIMNGRVIPDGSRPASFLSKAEEWNFSGCIILNIGQVGTGGGPSGLDLQELRSSYKGPLYYGGGVSDTSDLFLLQDEGYDGAIIATALHKKAVPLEWIRRGKIC